MKKLPLIIAGLLLGMLLLMFFSNQNEQPLSEVTRNDSRRDTSLSESNVNWDQSENRRPKGSIKEQIEFALRNPHSASEHYRIIVELLGTDETETLKVLGELRYPEDLAVDSSKMEEIMMITRATSEFYRPKSLEETLEKMEGMRETTKLHTSILSELFLLTEGPENAASLYDWVINNPTDRVTEISGGAIGDKLINFMPETAWEKTVVLPEGSTRANALAAVISTIASDDLNKAIDHINSLEVTQDLDQTISNLVGDAVSRDYSVESLLPLAASQVDVNYRSSSLQALLEKWASTDPEAVRYWAASDQDLPADQLAEIRLIAKQALQRLATE